MYQQTGTIIVVLHRLGQQQLILRVDVLYHAVTVVLNASWGVQPIAMHSNNSHLGCIHGVSIFRV